MARWPSMPAPRRAARETTCLKFNEQDESSGRLSVELKPAEALLCSEVAVKRSRATLFDGRRGVIVPAQSTGPNEAVFTDH